MNKSKSQLNQYCQKSGYGTAKYNSWKERDLFVCKVTVNGIQYSSVNGQTTKKEAEACAASVALQSMVQVHPKATSVDDLLEIVDREMLMRRKKISSLVQPQSQAQTILLSESYLPQAHLLCDEPAINNIIPYTTSFLTSSSNAVASSGLRECGFGAGSVGVSNPTRTQSLVESTISPARADNYPPPPPPPPLSIPSPPRCQVPTHASLRPSYNTPPHYPSILPYPPSNTPPRPPKTCILPLPTPQTPPLPLPTPPRNIPPRLPHNSSLTRPPQNIPPRPPQSTQNTPPRPPQSSPLSRPPQNPPPHSSHYVSPQTIPPRPHIPPHAPPLSPSSIPNIPPHPLLASSGEYDVITKPNPPSNSTLDSFEKKLENYCLRNKFPPPKYTIVQKETTIFMAKVCINGQEYPGSREFGSLDVAKENATLVALATIGLQELERERTVAEPPSSPAKSLKEQVVPTAAVVGVHHQYIPRYPTTTEAFSESQHISSSQHPQSKPPGLSLVSLSPSLQPQVQPALHPPAYFSSCKEQPPQVPHTVSSVFSQAEVKKMSSNYKITLNTFCQKNGIPVPLYVCTYPEDAVGYISTVTIREKVFSSGTHGTKRGAESAVASMALKSFGVEVDNNCEEGSNEIRSSTDQGSLDTPAAAINAVNRNISYKNLLQEHLQKSRITDLPRYETERTETGYSSSVRVRVAPDKTREFVGKPHANKRAAEQESAMVACSELGIIVS